MYTDFAYENFAKGTKHASCIEEYRLGRKGELSVRALSIQTREEEKWHGRPRGCYATIFCQPIWQMDEEALESAAEAVACELRKSLASVQGKRKRSESLLLVGLGNPDFTVDAIGPKTARQVSVTRHLPRKAGRISLASVVPDVQAVTGIETARQIAGIVDAISPDAVIAVDALATTEPRRIGSTVQIGNRGLMPGSGVEDAGRAVDLFTLGVPVIALGVPTVVESSHLIEGALRRGGITEPSARMRAVLTEESGYFVCPRESDLITDASSFLLARAVDLLCTKEE